MFKTQLVRGFVVVAVLATGGIAVATVAGGDSGSSPSPQAASSVSPRVVFDTTEASVRTAVLSACGGKALVATLDAAQTAHVDLMMADRARHAAALAGNPLTSGTGFQAGVDDTLHVQALDRDLASVLCPVNP
ncbi:MAG: hypothetical protein QOF97_1472 [Acidimicrobiaceae bacterium]